MSRELRGISGKMAVSALEKAGFIVLRQKGSHCLLYKKGKPLLVIPIHSKDLKIGLLKKEIKKAGLTIEQFEALL